jgi:hypothetical protein
LDYCVPGPNPLWQPASSNGVVEYLLNVPIATDPLMANEMYTARINNLFGFTLDEDDMSPAIGSYESFSSIISDEIFDGYASLINERFITNYNDFADQVRQTSIEFFLNVDEVSANLEVLQNITDQTQANIEELIDLREDYADLEYDFIIQGLTAQIEDGQANLSDNLASFLALDASQVTYIGPSEGVNSAYHDLVIALADEIGSFITPPINNPEYIDILDRFANVLDSGVAVESDIQEIEQELISILNVIGDATDPSSLVGAIISCVNQINEQGPYQGIDFAGYTERLSYPVPISEDLGLASLPITDTFLEDMIVSFDPNPRMFEIVSEDTNQFGNTEYTDDVIDLENFMNLGNSLF